MYKKLNLSNNNKPHSCVRYVHIDTIFCICLRSHLNAYTIMMEAFHFLACVFTIIQHLHASSYIFRSYDMRPKPICKLNKSFCINERTRIARYTGTLLYNVSLTKILILRCVCTFCLRTQRRHHTNLLLVEINEKQEITTCFAQHTPNNSSCEARSYIIPQYAGLTVYFFPLYRTHTTRIVIISHQLLCFSRHIGVIGTVRSLHNTVSDVHIRKHYRLKTFMFDQFFVRHCCMLPSWWASVRFQFLIWKNCDELRLRKVQCVRNLILERFVLASSFFHGNSLSLQYVFVRLGRVWIIEDAALK